MRQPIFPLNYTDEEGNPTGGQVESLGINIQWQAGPLGRGEDRKEPNGAFVEGVIEAALQRLQFYQTANKGKFACRQNAIAITKLEEALMWLDNRTTEREKAEVEGTHEAVPEATPA